MEVPAVSSTISVAQHTEYGLGDCRAKGESKGNDPNLKKAEIQLFHKQRYDDRNKTLAQINNKMSKTQEPYVWIDHNISLFQIQFS